MRACVSRLSNGVGSATGGPRQEARPPLALCVPQSVERLPSSLGCPVWNPRTETQMFAIILTPQQGFPGINRCPTSRDHSLLCMETSSKPRKSHSSSLTHWFQKRDLGTFKVIK